MLGSKVRSVSIDPEQWQLPRTAPFDLFDDYRAYAKHERPPPGAHRAAPGLLASVLPWRLPDLPGIPNPRRAVTATVVAFAFLGMLPTGLIVVDDVHSRGGMVAIAPAPGWPGPTPAPSRASGTQGTGQPTRVKPVRIVVPAPMRPRIKRFPAPDTPRGAAPAGTTPPAVPPNPGASTGPTGYPETMVAGPGEDRQPQTTPSPDHASRPDGDCSGIPAGTSRGPDPSTAEGHHPRRRHHRGHRSSRRSDGGSR